MELRNAWWIWLINEGMVDVAYGGARFDTGKAIDR